MSDETLQKTKRALNNVKDLQLRMVFDIGGMKIVDQQLTDFVMVEFLRLRTMIGEDLLRTVRSYHSKIEGAVRALEEDLTGYLGLSVSPAVVQRVKSSVRQFSNNCAVYRLLPETEYECSRLEVDEFKINDPPPSDNFSAGF